MRFQSVQLNNGKVLSGDIIEELVTDIVNKFSEAGLSCDEGKLVLESASDVYRISRSARHWIFIVLRSAV